MFDQWKRKIRHFLFEKQEDEKPPEPRESFERLPKSQNIQTRMTYHYPKEKPFRFPVIPDETNENKQSDIPAFQRKQRHSVPDNTSDYEEPVQSESEEVNEQPTQEEEKKQPVHRKIEPKSDEPFKPSDVPSPIHGFRRTHDSEDTDDGLAAKQQPVQESEHDEELISDDKTKKETAAAAEEQTEASRNSEKQNADVMSVFDQDNTSAAESSANDTSVETESRDVAAANDLHGSKAGENPKLDQTPNNKRRSEKNTKKQSNPTPPPFNVLMSANDKQSQTERVRNRQPRSSGNRTAKSYVLPMHLLDDPEPAADQDQLWVENERELLEKTLKYFHVRADVVNTTQGPSVTRFEVQPELGVKVSKIKNLSDDLKLNMAAKDIRIEAPIPGKSTIGIEIPNQHPRTVSLQEIFTDQTFRSKASPLTVGLGLSIEGEPQLTNIQKMPHGLIAGATGSGKSVCINTILISLIYNASYEDVKFMLIDPKMVELAPYNGIPHLISPVITDVKAATAALKWAVREMERRYEAFVQENVRDVERFNKKMSQQDRLSEKMSYMVIVIDELADLMMIAPQDVEDSISRIAQKARACGIHLLLATQRPSVDVITGLIKANIPTRIAFSVSSQVDSKTILDTGGAEKLLGKGDMLFTGNGTGKSIRLQGAFVSDEEIDRVTDYARSLAEPDYQFEQQELLQYASEDEETDELLNDAIAFVVDHNSASTSLLQRQFKIGYNRAARLMDAMEEQGIIAGQNGSKPREVLVSSAQLDD